MRKHSRTLFNRLIIPIILTVFLLGYSFRAQALGAIPSTTDVVIPSNAEKIIKQNKLRFGVVLSITLAIGLYYRYEKKEAKS